MLLVKDTGCKETPPGEPQRTWNPFNDPHPFGQLTEDLIFGAEFDKIQRRPHGPDSCEWPFMTSRALATV